MFRAVSNSVYSNCLPVVNDTSKCIEGSTKTYCILPVEDRRELPLPDKPYKFHLEVEILVSFKWQKSRNVVNKN